jgi:hypothetical protein
MKAWYERFPTVPPEDLIDDEGEPLGQVLGGDPAALPEGGSQVRQAMLCFNTEDDGDVTHTEQPATGARCPRVVGFDYEGESGRGKQSTVGDWSAAGPPGRAVVAGMMGVLGGFMAWMVGGLTRTSSGRVDSECCRSSVSRWPLTSSATGQPAPRRQGFARGPYRSLRECGRYLQSSQYRLDTYYHRLLLLSGSGRRV